MKNYVQEGDNIVATVPAGGVTSGQFILIGALGGVAVTTAAAGEQCVFNTEGVYELPKASSGAITQGAKLYWNDTTKVFTTTASGNTFMGYAFEAAADGATVVNVALANGL